MRKLVVMLTTVMLLLGINGVKAGEKENIEKLRQEQLKVFGSEGLVKPYDIRKKAKLYLSKPLSEQSISELKKLSIQTNAAANLFGMIVSEYKDYYSENYRYDFVQEKVAPFHDAYVKLSNELLDCRNQCYFNLGEKLKSKGKTLEAFLYYEDAYRLSSFTEDEGNHKGMRYKAEQELKSLLGVSDIPSFIYWK